MLIDIIINSYYKQYTTPIRCKMCVNVKRDECYFANAISLQVSNVHMVTLLLI